MKTEQEVVQAAWGKYWNEVKHNVTSMGIVGGWADNDVIHYNEDLGCDSKEFEFCGTLYRPASLKGIEDNNGWQETGYHHWRGVKLGKAPFKNGEYYEIGFMSATDNSFHNQGIKQFNNGFLDEGNYPLKPFPTHFKPIFKSENPLY